MKTLEQLWKENGEKPGLKVQSDSGTVFGIFGRTPKGHFVGYSPNAVDDADILYFSDVPYDARWSLYQEPKPRRLAYIDKTYGRLTLWPENEHIEKPERFIRARWLDEPEEK